ncbi:TRAP transporter, 4TM/12TM fusion protein [Marinobacterium stanieri]|uniref:TRAP transporter, 4TM/12TM fusion protein n=1 Tax=Marinobacterium stanieri TaxID=49186 RepID=A0A1N6UM70_9GAMM|nr:TRAP transporter, 4TM/12TM fusion protein [Marinobacterium stanieri]
MGFYVRVEARRSHAHAVEMDVRPVKEVLKEGWHCLLPLVVLVALLIYGFTPTYAAGISIISVVLASWISPKKMGLRDILDALAQGSRNMATTAMLLVAVGLVVNVVAMTGIGNTFSLMVTDWAGGSLLITLVLVALASLVLGMGLPVTAAYIVLATLSAPALYSLMAERELIELIVNGNLPETARAIFMLVDPNSLTALAAPMSEAQAVALLEQVPPDFKGQLLDQAINADKLAMILLAAHMIIFWLSQDSNVTPPVCLTAFAAAAIARTPPMMTGFTAWKIAKGLYIVPLLFAYTGFIGGSIDEVLTIFVFGILGLYAFVGLMEGYLEGPLNIVLRILSGACAVGLLWPHGQLVFDLIAAAVFIALFIYSRRLAPAVEATA